MDSKTTTERTTALSRINDEIVVRYNYDSVNQAPVDRIHGTIYKNEVTIGYFNASRNGESGLTFMSAITLSVEEKQQISARLYLDEQDTFSPE